MIYDYEMHRLAGLIVGGKVDLHRQQVYTDIRQALHSYPFEDARRRQLLAAVDEWAQREAQAFALTRHPAPEQRYDRYESEPQPRPITPPERRRWWRR